MTHSETLMLHLLQAALWQREPDGSRFGSDVDWGEILRVAAKQMVHGLVADAALRTVDEWPESEQMLRLEATLLQLKMGVVRDNQHTDRVLADVVGILRGEGIEPVLIKGQGVGRCYPQPDLRVCGDIDLYLGVQACEAIDQRLHLVGKRHAETSPKHINVDRDGVELELHRYVVNREDTPENVWLQRWTEEQLGGSQLRQVDIGGCRVTVPSAQFDALFLFYHLHHHLVTSGVGLRQFCDWVRVVHEQRADIDAAALEQQLRSAGLLRDWQVAARFAVDYLGMRPEDMPLYVARHRHAARCLAHVVLDEGNFGQDREQRFAAHLPKAYLGHKAYTFAQYTRKWYRLMRVSPATTWPKAKAFYVGSLRRLMRLE